jgi:hypothetical protein
VELRRGAGKAKTAHLVPWREVMEGFRTERPGLPVEMIEALPALERRNGSYRIRIEDLEFEDLEF